MLADSNIAPPPRGKLQRLIPVVVAVMVVVVVAYKSAGNKSAPRATSNLISGLITRAKSDFSGICFPTVGYQMMGRGQNCSDKKGYGLSTTEPSTCRDVMNGFVNGANYASCHYNLCGRTRSNFDVGFGLGSAADCEGDAQSSYYLVVRTGSANCTAAGGEFVEQNPGTTQVVGCRFSVCHWGRYYPTRVGGCPSGRTKFSGIVSAQRSSCQEMGGQGTEGSPTVWIYCTLDFCDTSCAGMPLLALE